VKFQLAFLCFALGLYVAGVPAAYAQQPAALVIEGGTLIDGNGGAAVPDAVVVVQGNRITSVSRRGQASYPSNATVIQADGKFILPGLWDSQELYVWYQGELMLSTGVTSTIDIGLGNEISIVDRDAVTHGKIIAPRWFTAIAHISGRERADLQRTGFETPLTFGLVPHSLQEAVDMVKLRLDAGADMVIFQDGALPIDYYKAAFEEIHKAGKPAFFRTTGPTVFVKDGVLAGADVIPHSAGIALAVTRDPAKSTNELDAYADMDDAKASELVQFLLQHKVTLVPTLYQKGAGYPKDWPRFVEQDRKALADPVLRAYYGKRDIPFLLGNLNPAPLPPAVRERRLKGYQNALRFHRMYVQAGGHVLAGSDAGEQAVPGWGLHHELQAFAEAGFTPMQIIQSATKWPAETLRVQDKIGTIEAGKLADLIIVNEDPLQNIANLEKIDAVILDGKVVDRNFHSWYQSPFGGSSAISGESNPVVESLPRVAAMKKATFRGGPSEGGAQGATGTVTVPAGDPPVPPPPGIERISTYMVTQGSPALSLTIQGFNFYGKSQVYFDNCPVPTRRISITEVEATIDKNLLERAGRFDIVVKNPPPTRYPDWGDGTSNTAHLIVNYKY
jgi:hypothetical protein